MSEGENKVSELDQVEHFSYIAVGMCTVRGGSCPPRLPPDGQGREVQTRYCNIYYLARSMWKLLYLSRNED